MQCLSQVCRQSSVWFLSILFVWTCMNALTLLTALMRWLCFPRWSGLITKINLYLALVCLSRFLWLDNLLAGDFIHKERHYLGPGEATSSGLPWSKMKNLHNFTWRLQSILRFSVLFFMIFLTCISVYVANHWSKLQSRSLYGLLATVVILIPECLRKMYLGYWINMFLFGSGRKKKKFQTACFLVLFGGTLHNQVLPARPKAGITLI